MFFVPLLTRYPGEKMQAFFRDQYVLHCTTHVHIQLFPTVFSSCPSVTPIVFMTILCRCSPRLAAFLEDHAKDPTTVGMPRV